MRAFLIIISLVLSSTVFSQATKEIKALKTNILESKMLSDFIADIPKDCKITGFIFSANFGSSLKEFTVMGDAIPVEVKDMINKRLEKGKSFFVENVKSDCAKINGANYKIILE